MVTQQRMAQGSRTRRDRSYTLSNCLLVSTTHAQLSIACLQRQQRRLRRNHASTHSLWYTCPQRSRRTSAPGAMSSMHIVQVASSGPVHVNVVVLASMSASLGSEAPPALEPIPRAI